LIRLTSLSRRAIAIIIAGFFTVLVAFAIRYAYGLILPHMLPSLGISKTEAGVIFSSYFMAYTLFSPLLGLLADRVDARKLITLFVTILGIGAFLMSFSSSVFQASLFYAIAGFGHSACWAPVVAVVLRWVGETRRGTALAIVDLGSATGIALWSFLIPLIVGSYSWQAVWVSLGVSALLVAGLNSVVIRSSPPIVSGLEGAISVQKKQMPIKVAYAAIFRNPKFYFIGLSYLLLSFSILIPFTFLATYATQELGIAYKSALGLIAVIAITGALGKLALGHLSDTVGRVRVMMLCGAFTAVGCLGMAYSRPYYVLVFFTVLFGIGYGTIWPVYAASARDYFSKNHAGSVVGLWTVYHGLGSIFSPIMSGWVIDATGRYVGAFILAMISSALSMLLLFPLAKGARNADS
jgi:MFS family permease